MTKERIGYKNPPKSTRFKKGQSGNPKGRPKGSKNIDTLVLEELNAAMQIQEQGQVKTVQKKEAIIKVLLKKALSGDLKAACTLFTMAGKAEQKEALNALSASQSAINEDDIKLLEAFGIKLPQGLGE